MILDDFATRPTVDDEILDEILKTAHKFAWELASAMDFQNKSGKELARKGWREFIETVPRPYKGKAREQFKISNNSLANAFARNRERQRVDQAREDFYRECGLF